MSGIAEGADRYRLKAEVNVSWISLEFVNNDDSLIFGEPSGIVIPLRVGL